MLFGGLKIIGVLFELFAIKKCSRGAPLDFWLELLPGETLCKFFRIFPPKDLI